MRFWFTDILVKSYIHIFCSVTTDVHYVMCFLYIVYILGFLGKQKGFIY